ncbi:dihydrofolate reductase family protein [Microlunatus ginsengisoli]|uniref:Dihydrofolate reductase family protein n=1 Tax=Microlunatus ginsengisoli TaxID=363863 RepID=A0ABP7AAY9_9ACTN
MSSSGKIIVIEFTTLDGVVEDPDGRSGTPFGGWAFRFGPEAIAGDKFRLGPILQTGVLLFGRRTWQHFSRLWPSRTDPFSTAMNGMPKYVVSSGAPDLDAWSNSRLLGDDLVPAARDLARRQDVVVIGSLGVVRALAAQDAVDEYRLLTFPTFTGAGGTLFEAPVELRLVDIVVQSGVTLGTYVPVRDGSPRAEV